jgi:hypothetical protein
MDRWFDNVAQGYPAERLGQIDDVTRLQTFPFSDAAT